MTHVVQKGESLLEIAKKFRVRYSDLLKINNIDNANVLFVGQVIKLPDDFEVAHSQKDVLTPENIERKFAILINFIEGKKLKKDLPIYSKECVKLILDTCIEMHVTDLKMIAYVLATTYWETGAYKQKYLFQPIEEAKKGLGRPYGIPDKRTGKTYYGRGFVQLTWYLNYERFTVILGRLGFDVDLVNKPDQAMIPKVAALILVIGMRDGKFTGHCLDEYFSPVKADWYNARRIINSTDKAVIIKAIAEEIYYIIKD